MSLFPKIARPCPYVANLDAVMDGDFCRMCKRQVHDLTAMDRAAREAFLSDCGGDVCVRYTVWMKPAMAAAALAVTGGGMSVLAASLDQPPTRVVDHPAIGAASVAGEPAPLAGMIEPPPLAQNRRPSAKPRKVRPPKPVRPVEVEIPYVTAGLPVPVEPVPSPSPAPVPPTATDSTAQ